jgi:Fe-S cluster assembly protein SufD
MQLKEDALLSWRKKAYERFLAMPFETPLPAVRNQVDGTADLLFVDGFPTSHSLAEALKNYGLFLQNRWSKPPQDAYTALNHALAEGAFIYVPRGVQKMHIHHIITTPNLVSPRLQITVGKGAELTIIQTVEHRTLSPFVNGTIDIALEPNAKCHFYDLQMRSDYTSVTATLKKDSRLQLFYGTEGNARYSVTAELLEPGAAFEFKSLAMLTGDRKAEIHALVDHAAPNCTSRQHVKTVVAGQSRSHFNGKIYVQSEAQKTEAYQLNNNLILSKTAIATTEPNLEIFADDVKASHGATVAQLSEDELFYLQARGIAPRDARLLLTDAFCRELIDQVPEPQALIDAMRRVTCAN